MPDREMFPTRLFVGLVVLLGLGILSVTLSVVEYRTSGSAQRDDVLANRRVIERLAQDRQDEQDDARMFRERVEENQACMVDLLIAIAKATDAERKKITNPCPASPYADEEPVHPPGPEPAVPGSPTTTAYRPRNPPVPRAPRSSGTSTTRPPATTSTTRPPPTTHPTTTTTRPPATTTTTTCGLPVCAP